MFFVVLLSQKDLCEKWFDIDMVVFFVSFVCCCGDGGNDRYNSDCSWSDIDFRNDITFDCELIKQDLYFKNGNCNAIGQFFKRN